jgi:hypothetical protein
LKKGGWGDFQPLTTNLPRLKERILTINLTTLDCPGPHKDHQKAVAGLRIATSLRRLSQNRFKKINGGDERGKAGFRPVSEHLQAHSKS